MPRPPSTETANEIINQVAAEVGIAPVVDPYGSKDQQFIQLTYLLNAAGRELTTAFDWDFLAGEHQITTQQGDSGDYPLPSDFSHMKNQTGWERAGNVPLFGPLSPQDWTYLLGRDLVTSTIYASFRLRSGYFSIFPQPPPANLDLNFEYTSNAWVGASADPDDDTQRKSKVTEGGDVPLFNNILISRYTKVKYLASKGLETTAAQLDFDQIFSFLTGVNLGAEILSAGRNRSAYPYIDPWRNVPDTGIGGIG